MTPRTVGALAAIVAGLGTATVARAEAPFYGYSPYFGGPAIYYTPDTDVQQATTFRDGVPGFGVRTYTAGGPFWGYRQAPASVSRVGYDRRPRRSRALRRKG